MKVYKSLHLTVIGSSHIKDAKPCQDFSKTLEHPRYGLAVVCDGHGSAKHFRSALGSELACEICIESIKKYMGLAYHSNKNRGIEMLSHLEKNIIFNWNSAISKHLDENPFTDEELAPLSDKDKKSLERNFSSAYGTTLIAVVMANTFTFGIQIGDGDCIIFENGDTKAPIPEDENLQFSVTTSMCDEKAISEFRAFWMDKAVDAALVSTDGVANSFSSKTYYERFALRVVEDVINSESDEATEDLSEFLSKLSLDGSGDDMSIALIVEKKK